MPSTPVPGSGSATLSASDISIEGSEFHQTPYSILYRGSCHGSPIIVETPLFPLALNEQNLLVFQQELQYFYNHAHPNLLQLLGACTTPNLAIVSEVVNGNYGLELASCTAPFYRRLFWAKEAAQGISWLHGGNDPIIVKDFTVRSLYYDKAGQTKLQAWSPFLCGMENIPDVCLVYRAPEILQSKEYGVSADSYTFGLLLFELFTGTKPYTQFANWEAFYQAICIKHERPILPSENCSDELKQLINLCWHPNPGERPSFSVIVELLEEKIIPQYRALFHESKILESIKDDHNGAVFWKRFFYCDLGVDWKSFNDSFFPVRDYAGQRGPVKMVSELLPNMPSEEELEKATTSQLMELANRNQYGRALVERTIQNRKTSGYTITDNLSHDRETIRHMICDDHDIVTLESFGNLLGRFGPLDANFQARIEEVVSNPYFHGKLSYDRANLLLQANMEKNPCLVRFSGSRGRENAFCICYVAPGPKIKHLPVVYHSGKGFRYKDSFYDSLTSLMATSKLELGFGEPCPGSSWF